nr:MAG TPA: hypothetical protein [Caudoviricetes sp.]
MRLVNQISVNDDTFSIIKMDTLDHEAITEHVGPLKGQWICYNGLMTLYPDCFNNTGFLAMLWADITPEMTFETQREAELYAQMRIYQKAYAQMLYSVSMMQSTISKIQDAKLEIHFDHKEEN